jgi:hypothetical protein
MGNQQQVGGAQPVGDSDRPFGVKTALQHQMVTVKKGGNPDKKRGPTRPKLPTERTVDHPAATT